MQSVSSVPCVICLLPIAIPVFPDRVNSFISFRCYRSVPLVAEAVTDVATTGLRRPHNFDNLSTCEAVVSGNRI